jgi:hypothetical protein
LGSAPTFPRELQAEHFVAVAHPFGLAQSHGRFKKSQRNYNSRYGDDRNEIL